jgi:hypothetical protein
MLSAHWVALLEIVLGRASFTDILYICETAMLM